MGDQDDPHSDSSDGQQSVADLFARGGLVAAKERRSLGQIEAIHPARHDDIREQEINIRVFLEF